MTTTMKVQRSRGGGRPKLQSWADASAWAPALQEFTRRNAGRHARLEVDDRTLGPRTHERDDTILGVDYDPRGGRVEIMLGDIDGGPRHHLRSIEGVTGVDLLTGSSGRDLVLRIAHGRGRMQTLVTLVS